MNRGIAASPTLRSPVRRNGSLALTRVLSGFLFGVQPTDPVTFAVVSALLVVVGALACWLPARRATKVDPVVALRAE